MARRIPDVERDEEEVMFVVEDVMESTVRGAGGRGDEAMIVTELRSLSETAIRSQFVTSSIFQG